MAAESGENLNFPPLHRRLLYHPVGQKFARNRYAMGLKLHRVKALPKVGE